MDRDCHRERTHVKSFLISCRLHVVLIKGPIIKNKQIWLENLRCSAAGFAARTHRINKTQNNALHCNYTHPRLSCQLFNSNWPLRRSVSCNIPKLICPNSRCVRVCPYASLQRRQSSGKSRSQSQRPARQSNQAMQRQLSLVICPRISPLPTASSATATQDSKDSGPN